MVPSTETNQFPHLTTDFYFSPVSKEEVFATRDNQWGLYVYERSGQRNYKMTSKFVEEGYTKANNNLEKECFIKRNGLIIAICSCFEHAYKLSQVIFEEEKSFPTSLLDGNKVLIEIDTQDWGMVRRLEMTFSDRKIFKSCRELDPEHYKSSFLKKLKRCMMRILTMIDLRLGTDPTNVDYSRVANWDDLN